jgi:hypothetical protein
MIALSGQRGVPFTTIEFEDGRVEKVLGYDVRTLENLLKTPN